MNIMVMVFVSFFYILSASLMHVTRIYTLRLSYYSLRVQRLFSTTALSFRHTQGVVPCPHKIELSTL